MSKYKFGSATDEPKPPDVSVYLEIMRDPASSPNQQIMACNAMLAILLNRYEPKERSDATQN
jgi:hypothetical protein